MRDFEQAVASKPKDAGYRHSLGATHYYAGRQEQVRSIWKQACTMVSPEETRHWHKELAQLGYYEGNIGDACDNRTIEAFEACAKVKCHF